MKNVFLIFGLFFCTQLWAGVFSEHMLSVSAKKSCVIDKEDVKCWGDGSPMLRGSRVKGARFVATSVAATCAIGSEGLNCFERNIKPVLKNIRFIALYDTSTPGRTLPGPNACAIDDGGLKCWTLGYSPFSRPPESVELDKNVPTFKYPRMVSMSEYHICALGDSEVKCWWRETPRSNVDQGQVNVPKLVNPKSIVTSTYASCALDDDKVKCWGKLDGVINQIPVLNKPRQISLADQQMCALDEDGVKCWSAGLDKKVTEVAPLKNPLAVGAGGAHSCALDEDGVKCWGDKSNYRYGKYSAEVPTIKNPRSLSIGNQRVCVLDDEGPKCWGEGIAEGTPFFYSHKNPEKIVWGESHQVCTQFKNEISCGYKDLVTLKNPKDFAMVSSRQACAIDDEGLKCWRIGEQNFDNTGIPVVKNPKSIRSWGGLSCVLDDNGPQCWSSYGNIDGVLDVPRFQNVRMMGVGWNFGCVLVDDGVRCWGKNEYGKLNVPSLKNPSMISVGSGACALDDEGVKCWGNISKEIPPLKNPREVAVGHGVACAIDDEGVKCWGGGYNFKNTHVLWSQYGPYDANRLDFKSYLQEIMYSLTPARFLYASMMEAFKVTDPDSNYFSLALSSPIILTMDSEDYILNIIPDFKRSMNIAHKQLKVNSLLEGVVKTADNQLNRQIALKSIQAAVTVALEFVSIQEKAELQDLLRQIGQLMIDPSNTSQIKDLIVKLESPASPLQKLTSPKSAFLIDVINLAKDWLKRVK